MVFRMFETFFHSTDIWACTESELRFGMLSRCAFFPGDFKSGMGVRASTEADPKKMVVIL